jgi:hypothetical protein
LRPAAQLSTYVYIANTDKDFFGPIGTLEVADGADPKPLTQQQPNPVPKGIGRPPPIILTALINLLKFQGGLKPLLKSTFEFHPPGM